MNIPILDCSNEVTAVKDVPNCNRNWLAADIKDSDWIVPFSDEMENEFSRLGSFINANPVQNLQRKWDDIRLPALESGMKQVKHILNNGVGFCILDRLPVDQFSRDTCREIYWLLGQMVGPPVAQKWNGEMIYEVTDTGETYGYGVRGSHTTVELVFHVDNAFARRVPDYVGLFCWRPAKQGGISRFCSLYAVHQRMQNQYPKLLSRLYKPMLFDRQKEHAPGEAKVCFAPFFSWSGDRLNARANSTLVRKGYEVAEKAMDPELSDALKAIDEVCSADDLWFEGPLQRGQIQYLNNHEIGHYRSAFEDSEDPDEKRYLMRLWHREEGTNSYDGEMI